MGEERSVGRKRRRENECKIPQPTRNWEEPRGNGAIRKLGARLSTRWLRQHRHPGYAQVTRPGRSEERPRPEYGRFEIRGSRFRESCICVWPALRLRLSKKWARLKRLGDVGREEERARKKKKGPRWLVRRRWWWMLAEFGAGGLEQGAMLIAALTRGCAGCRALDLQQTRSGQLAGTPGGHFLDPEAVVEAASRLDETRLRASERATEAWKGREKKKNCAGEGELPRNLAVLGRFAFWGKGVPPWRPSTAPASSG
ncbi:hypothetical protein HDV57DRAFT_422445 [Trichoderma longibrachiatum]